MKLLVLLPLVAAAMELGGAQGCCSTDQDCLEKLRDEDAAYLNQFDKTVECNPGCPGLMNCNMFGMCEQCRGCFETCEGAIKYMEMTGAPAEFVTFCSGIGISDVSACGEGGASGDGSGSASMYGDGSASGSGMDSASEETVSSASPTPVPIGSASGGGSGSGSMYGDGSASASGMDSASEETVGSASPTPVPVGSASGGGSGSGSMYGDGSASGSGMDSASGSAGASGSGSTSSMSATASGSGDGSRVAEIDGCDCGSAELDPSFAAYFCENQKSMYCDLECVDDPDPADALYPSKGGLWCQPEGWKGCRMCKFDCTEYKDEDCVPCPPGLKNWC